MPQSTQQALHPTHSLVFTDSDAHNIKLLDFETEGNANEISTGTFVGTGVSGSKDGSTAEFVQPTGICTEGSTIFVSDAAMGQIRMTAGVSSLVQFLKILNIYTRLFGLHLHKEEKKVLNLEDGCAGMTTVLDYMTGHIRSVKEFFKITREPQSPDGAMACQIMRDLKLQMNSMVSLKANLQEINCTYSPVMTSFTTLLCEHFFAEMRQTYYMPLVHQFAISFNACTREMVECLSVQPFHYFTSRRSTYSP